MNLKENIHRIKSLMVEEKENPLIRKMIDEVGVENTIKMIGDFDMVKPYLTIDDKISYVKERVTKISYDFGGDLFGLSEVNEYPIDYETDRYKEKQIEYIGKDGVYVDVYSIPDDTYLGDFFVLFDNLREDILDEIITVVMNVE
jgi:hypothetical protein